jgi:hypothetical protein
VVKKIVAVPSLRRRTAHRLADHSAQLSYQLSVSTQELHVAA